MFFFRLKPPLWPAIDNDFPKDGFTQVLSIVSRLCVASTEQLLVLMRETIYQPILAGRKPMAVIEIRKAVNGDAPRLHQLHISSVQTLCSGHYAPEVIDGWLSNRRPKGYLPSIQRGDLFVAESDSKITGFGEAVPGVIVAIYVDPTAVKQGIGSAIMGYALKIAKSGQAGPVRLEATLNAVGFYERFGFRQVGRIGVQRGSINVPCVAMELHE